MMMMMIECYDYEQWWTSLGGGDGGVGLVVAVMVA
jgi:hypothetical protein